MLPLPNQELRLLSKLVTFKNFMAETHIKDGVSLSYGCAPISRIETTHSNPNMKREIQ